MSQNLDLFLRQIAYLPRALQLVWCAARGWTVAWVILLIVQGLLPAATVYLSRQLVDSLVAVLNTGATWPNMQPVLSIAAIMAGLLLLTEVAGSINGWVSTAQAELIRDYFSALIHDKSVALDMAFYDSPDYHDRLARARDDLGSRPLALLESSGALIQNALTLVAMGTLLIPYGVWLPAALLLTTAPAVYVLLRFNARYHEWWENSTLDRRRAQYYDVLLTNSEIAPELRLFGLGPRFQSAFQALRKQLRQQRLALSKSQFLTQLSAALIGVGTSGVIIVWMVWRALIGVVTLGDLALFYQAFSRGQALMHSLLGNMGQIYSHTLFLGNMFEFLALKPQIQDDPNPQSIRPALEDGIRFHNVDFRYPGTNQLILKNLNLTIPSGRVTAIVGPIGAGKTTLIKLLCRFYDVTAGSIEFSGIDIRRCSLKELRQSITVLFQWPIRYFMTAGENIKLSEIRSEANLKDVEHAAMAAGIHDRLLDLPMGYDTQLGRSFFNGIDLSGGEWQRLALARAFLRKAPIMILDEPTSHLDSWAEADWFDRFRVLAKDRTSVIVTHRFTIARQADLIHVVDGGTVVESGTHDELVARAGLYARSWHLQMKSAQRPRPPAQRPTDLEFDVA